jgi:uncharacterized Rmd1/YagE family protein
MYHLPLLPGYGPDTNIRSSVPAKLKTGKSFLSRLSEAEENGYQGTYFSSPAARSPTSLRDGYISSASPVESRKLPLPPSPSSPAFDEAMLPSNPDDIIPPTDPTPSSDTDTMPEPEVRWQTPPRTPPRPKTPEDEVAEVVFFDYGVVVFFGMEERNERDILEDLAKAGIMKRPIAEDDWEIEECHFMVGCSATIQRTVLMIPFPARPTYILSQDIQ